MFAKLERYRAERDRAYQKRDAWDAKAKEWERKCTEEEKLTIHELVHEARMTPEELALLLRMSAAERIGRMNEGQNVPKEREENTDEESC